jgi:hypothetical protein
MSKTFEINRRTALRGLGTALALPCLEAMLPSLATAAPAAGVASGKFPLRLAFLYVPNGKDMPSWNPTGEGTAFKFAPTMEPLAPFRDDLIVFSGLTHQKAFANGDGGGDHARAMSTYLTGVQIRKTPGAEIKAGISADQVAASQVGMHTRFPSIEIGCEGGLHSGSCDSGYSCAYSNSMSWRGEKTPVAKEINPRLVFDRLFTAGRPGESAEARARRETYQQSILDFVRDDARRLHDRLGGNDRQKLDEYLTDVRELEQRIERARKFDSQPQKNPGIPRPSGIPSSYQEHLRLMADMLVLAFRTDTTRIATYAFANESSNRSYPFLNVPDGHHSISHHGKDPKKIEKIKAINKFHVEQFAYILDKMRQVKEGEGTLLDHSLIVYGSGIEDGDSHSHANLPIVMAGRGNGTVKTGRHIVYPSRTPLCNLWLNLLDRTGAKCDHLGDSTGRLKGLEG